MKWTCLDKSLVFLITMYEHWGIRILKIQRLHDPCQCQGYDPSLGIEKVYRKASNGATCPSLQVRETYLSNCRPPHFYHPPKSMLTLPSGNFDTWSWSDRIFSLSLLILTSQNRTGDFLDGVKFGNPTRQFICRIIFSRRSCLYQISFHAVKIRPSMIKRAAETGPQAHSNDASWKTSPHFTAKSCNSIFPASNLAQIHPSISSHVYIEPPHTYPRSGQPRTVRSSISAADDASKLWCPCFQ